MAVVGNEIKPSMWRNLPIGFRLGFVRGLVSLLLCAVVAAAGCRVLSSGLPGRDATQPDGAEGNGSRADAFVLPGSVPAVDVGEPPGVESPGCSDGTREGFRNATLWPSIAGCAGGFSVPGVIGSPGPKPTCRLVAGDGSTNPNGLGCSAADLCATGWHLCRDGTDVVKSSPTGDCEGCVAAGEPRFFLVASGASPMGICAPDPTFANDLHGCGGLGQPESPECSPLTRRMGFADCIETGSIWACGGADKNLQEAAWVTKTGPSLGGVLCCKD
jgi:hypothetical protein